MVKENITCGRKYLIDCEDGAKLLAYILEVNGKLDFGIMGFINHVGNASRIVTVFKYNNKVYRSIDPNATYEWLDVEQHKSEFDKKDLGFLVGKENFKAMKNEP